MKWGGGGEGAVAGIFLGVCMSMCVCLRGDHHDTHTTPSSGRHFMVQVSRNPSWCG